MDEKLLSRIIHDIDEENGTYASGAIPPSTEEMREQMRDPENLLEFLALFGKAIGTNMCSADMCQECRKAMGNADCIRFRIKKIARNYAKPTQKYRIVKVTSDKFCVKHTIVLPGEFEKQHAEDIVKAYNSKEYKIEAV